MCAVSAAPLLRMPGVCLIFGGVMTIDTATSTIYSVLQNNSATSPCGGGGGIGIGIGGGGGGVGVGGGGGGADGVEGVKGTAVALARRFRSPAAAAGGVDTAWKVLGISFASKVPAVSGEPVVCASQALCPVSIAATAAPRRPAGSSRTDPSDFST